MTKILRVMANAGEASLMRAMFWERGAGLTGLMLATDMTGAGHG